jgi:hypothetical protein
MPVPGKKPPAIGGFFILQHHTLEQQNTLQTKVDGPFNKQYISFYLESGKI